MNIGAQKINITDEIPASGKHHLPATPEARARAIIELVTPVMNEQEQVALLQSITSSKQPAIISFINAHGFNMAWKCPEFAANLARADLLLRDGIGVHALMRALHLPSGRNMNGTDFIPTITQHFTGRRIALCGTREPHLSHAAARVTGMGGQVVLQMDGFQPAEAYIDAVQQAKPDLVILGMGMPKQEAVSVALAEALQYPTVIVNGGAILDFWADRFPRAPRLWQCLGLEWLFRLLQEPRRLWKRYILGGAVFVGRILRLRFYTLPLKTHDPASYSL